MTDTFATADLSDAFPGRCTPCETQFRQFGGKRVFAGPIRTLRVSGDNLLLRQALESPGNGAVLVVDGGARLDCAILGDNLARLGLQNGWAGVVIYAAIRDIAVLATLHFAVKALGTNPRRGTKLGTGETDIPVSFGAATFTPGHWLYSDEDGIIVADGPLTS